MQGLSLEAMRMLAPSWRTVWGDDAHPVEPAETVTKALVLLTDGQNGAYSDGWGGAARTSERLVQHGHR